MLNPESPIPLYRQLADLLLAKIRAGEYLPGTRIPSEHSLAAQFKIGRPTARQATDWLVRRRYLIRKRGSGTYVSADEPREVDLFSLGGTMSAFQEKGISSERVILEPTRLILVEPGRDNPFAGEKAYYFSRLSRVARKPVLLEDFYLHPGLFPGIDSLDLASRPLSQVVNEVYYMRPVSGRQNFRIGTVSRDKASALEITPATPILIVQRLLNFPAAPHGIYSELHCRTDQFVFSQNIGDITDD